MPGLLANIFYNKKDALFSFLLLVLFLATLPLYLLKPTPSASAQQVALLEPAAIPVTSSQPDTLDTLLASFSARAIFVSDEASGTVLLAKNADEELYPASTTKLLTALVAREQYYLDQVFTVKQETFTVGNTMNLLPGEQISLNQLLKGLLIVSANDAGFVLANNHPQGYNGFVEAMNQKAEQLGLSNSSFTNPSGLDAAGHQMTARDLAILTREVFKDPVLAEMMKTTTATAQNVTGELVHPLGHTHQLLYSDPTALGGKTGTTDAALQVLVTKFARPDANGVTREIIIAILASQDRYTETALLADWVFANYTWQDFEW